MRVSAADWQAMKGYEKEAHVFTSLRVPVRELAHAVAEWEYEQGKKPNALFVSMESLAEIPVRLKKVLQLRVIPMDADPGTFIISQEDPWEWGNFFYS